MTATLLDTLMILALGVLAGAGAGLVIGFLTGYQKRTWTLMQKKDKIITILLIIAGSAVFITLLTWYVFWYPAR